MIKNFKNKFNTIRFWSKVRKTKKCWIWTGAKILSGYGRFGIKNKAYYSHRISWSLVNGTIPKGFQILHKCDNPSCVNPNHLFIGTQKDNMLDMMKKGRKAKIKLTGEINPKAVLTEKQVKEIRRKYSDRSVGVEKIASK